ncbi:uncharacterized protein OCT59_024602 [Rhizophagus irregularis]|uniref:Uncharacterized protein n=1 Tax=Rhizophagus irregularis (strain DAOM 181602 / DAOM 197198 / MUCL 43194) TaxID=747089 RepID=A0A2H5RNB6_RHIID|nr:hypothetical protein GLOIN_2v1815060 [Rhizophagus irregularis DAOM 181602=DAOM 197198]POG60904.1 hypothetical protein GLOIN_2v1815060 [Rhizophagus irregularis DAOM 181602=DAOM 197198]UZO04211.1 hypothetical protein OCT59_024602 [Rhizophagus irregularis]GBC19255.1 hypothetical protein GLOIN_2v1815060 [Rhizophagus irregularis DAOM 181602=DAOM 197198]|eukprot:XP_025167770.1 hypothetical protein GLOIN_2v1815060 [Rhizophagus irregularis DAOM 181602=DAOM 197198]
MTSNTNSKTVPSETLAQIYELFLYKKKDIIAIQEKLGINGDTNRKIEKTLADSYKLFLHLVEEMVPIQEMLGIVGNPILAVVLRSDKACEASAKISFSELYNWFLYLKEDVMAIQEKLGIIGYTNQAITEEADKNARIILRKFEEFHGPLEDDLGVILPKYGEMGVKRIMFTGEGLPLFPRVSPQQLHEIFVKNPANTSRLEQVI